MGFLRATGFFVAVGLLAIAGVALWQGTGPLPDPERCIAKVGGRTVVVTPEQGEIASLIAAVGIRRHLPARAVSIALATAYQESKLLNIAHGDRDSIGVFQQRPSQGWGTVAQIRDPYYATNKFYDALVTIKGYQEMRITEAAQKVQRSGFPEAYEDHALDGRTLSSALTGNSIHAFNCVVRASPERGSANEVTQALQQAYGDVSTTRPGRQDVTVRVGSGPIAQRRGWSIAHWLVANAGRLHIQSVTFAGQRWSTGRDSEAGWVADEEQELTISMG